jgi:hypothetical protein
VAEAVEDGVADGVAVSVGAGVAGALTERVKSPLWPPAPSTMMWYVCPATTSG